MKNKFQKLLKLVANENKFKIIQLLMGGEMCVCEIGKKLKIEQSLVSHHVNDLKKAKIINTRKSLTWVHCSLNLEIFKKLQNMYLDNLGYKNINYSIKYEQKNCHL